MAGEKRWSVCVERRRPEANVTVVLDIGCGPGFFSIDMTQMVGIGGGFVVLLGLATNHEQKNNVTRHCTADE